MRKRYQVGVILAALVLLVGCATLRQIGDKVPACIYTDSCVPSPAPPPPSPVPTIAPPASPEPDPTPKPSPIPTIAPPASPEPEATPKPSPAIPAPCTPTCAPPPAGFRVAGGVSPDKYGPEPGACYAPVKDDWDTRYTPPIDNSIDWSTCDTCGNYRAYNVRQGHWIDEGRKDGWLRSNGQGTAGWDKFVTKECDLVTADGSLVYTRESGHMGRICPRKVEGKPCAPTPAPPGPSPSGPQPGPSPSGPQPGPTPAACPPLVRWGTGIHAQMTPAFEGIPKEPAFAGNTIEFDSTARFGGQAGGRGNACNAEHHAVCDAQGDDHGPNWRHCEDPRGPVFTYDCAADKVKITNGGWGIQFVRVQAGTCRVKACPRPDVHDELGQPVNVLGDGCGEGSVAVQ